MPRSGFGNQTAFSTVYISGVHMTFSGGPHGRTQVQTLSIHRTPEGTVYLDEIGSSLKRWEPQNGIVEAKNVFGYTIMFKRQAPAIAYQPQTIGSTYGFGSPNPNTYGLGSTNPNSYDPPAYSQLGFSNQPDTNKY